MNAGHRKALTNMFCRVLKPSKNTKDRIIDYFCLWHILLKARQLAFQPSFSWYSRRQCRAPLVIIDQTGDFACEKCLLDAVGKILWGKFPPTSLYVASTAFKFFARGEIITKMVMSDSSEDYNPFRLTKEEIASLDPNYKKPKKKVNNWLFVNHLLHFFLLKPPIFCHYFWGQSSQGSMLGGLNRIMSFGHHITGTGTVNNWNLRACAVAIWLKNTSYCTIANLLFS